jgi:hypothetical protein
VRDKTIPDRTRKIIDQRHIPKMILASPIDSVSLKGIHSIGSENGQVPARASDPDHLGGKRQVIIDMLHNLVREHKVKGAIEKGKPLTYRLRDPGDPTCSLQAPLSLHLDAKHLASHSHKGSHIHPNTATRVKNPTFSGISPAKHHLETPFLSLTPDI